jgi:hypothetical protein
MTDNRFLWEYDEALGFDGLCGIDEVGRGPLAGPVCAACVVLPRGLELPALNDSKKMTEKRREETYALLIACPEVYYGIGFASQQEIDEINILQATGTRLTRADYVSCPSCGRTLYNIQEATARIRKATEHLKGVKIAVMGCIVNGPGEMADADFGYVGGAPNKINLYVKHTPVKFNIPQEEAVERLVDLIKEYGRWVDPK